LEAPSPMPFGKTSGQDSGSWRNPKFAGMSLQCLSAKRPVRTAQAAREELIDAASLQCLSAKRPVRTVVRNVALLATTAVSNAFRQNVRSGHRVRD